MTTQLAEIEMVQIKIDMKLTKNKEVTVRGYPFWHKHKAKKLLAADVKSGKLPQLYCTCRSNITNFTNEYNRESQRDEAKGALEHT
jgi:hypothetical protein